MEARFHRVTERRGWATANPGRLHAALHLPPLQHRPRGAAQPGRALDRRRRASQPQAPPAHLLPGRGVTALARRSGSRGTPRPTTATSSPSAPILACAWARWFRSVGSASTWTAPSCGSRRPRPASRWSFRSPASSPPCWSAAGPRPGVGTKAGCSPHPRASPAISRTFTATMPASAGQRARASGSTVCATPSSPWPSATSCCPAPFTKRLVNHGRDDDITEGYAADWTVEQLREPAQRVADRIEALLKC